MPNENIPIIGNGAQGVTSFFHDVQLPEKFSGHVVIRHRWNELKKFSRNEKVRIQERVREW